MAEFMQPSTWTPSTISLPFDSSYFTSVGWSESVWTFGDVPMLNITLRPYTPFERNKSFADTSPYTAVQSVNASTFSSVGWSSDVWNLSARPTLTTTLNPYVPFEYKNSFRDFGRYALITDVDSRKKASYESVTWDMERVWVIKEGATRPRLVKRVAVNLGVPLTHSMTYRYVVPSLDGTMNYKGKTWVLQDTFHRYPDPAPKGTAGQVITYTIPESDLEVLYTDKEGKEKELIWFASGVSDELGAGGYSNYREEKTRSVTVSNKMAATVNFYFTEARYIPSVMYRVNISTPEGIVGVSAFTPDTSPIHFTTNGIDIYGLLTTKVGSEFASHIHVAMPDGIKALLLHGEYELEEIFNEEE